MSGRAVLIGRAKGRWRSTATHYRLTPPAVITNDQGQREEYADVVVSATTVHGIPETYVFPADSEGNITGWGELEGSTRGEFDHALALHNLGYEVRP